MDRKVSRRITGAVSAVALLVLVVGGLAYLRTVSNAERIDDRNLRELTRTARSVGGTVSNLQEVLSSLAQETGLSDLRDKAELIPHLTIDTVAPGESAAGIGIDEEAGGAPACPGTERGAAIRRVPAGGSLQVCYRGVTDSIGGVITGTYSLQALEPFLTSDYMEAVFLADGSGGVFLWAPEGTVTRVHGLAALDSLDFGAPEDPGRLDASTIVRAPIAGRDYHFYLVPLRINLAPMEGPDAGAGSDEIRWMVGGVVAASAHRQESLSLHPTAAIRLGFLAILGLLAIPFVRTYTMGPRERLRVGHMLALVLSLILGAGLVGLALADLAHYGSLKDSVYDQLDSTADRVARNIDQEIQSSLHLLDRHSRELEQMISAQGTGSEDAEDDPSEQDPREVRPEVDPVESLFDRSRTDLESIRMRAEIPQDTLYPEFHMVFWADSTGDQVAKWTTRLENTPRRPVRTREYHRAIRERRGWPQVFPAASDEACEAGTAATVQRRAGADVTYFLQFFRSWTTGEKLAAISSSYPREGRGDPRAAPRGVGVVVTEMASLRRPVLPAGVGAAIVDVEARTLFHTWPERILEENFAEETDRADVLRSILHARTCHEVDLMYGGRPNRVVIRPLSGRPLFLITFMDRSLLDTVRFEAWFVAGALFGTLAFLFFAAVALLDRIVPARIAWIWPDVDEPGKHLCLLALGLPFLLALLVRSLWPGALPSSPASFLVPVQFLGLGLVVLSRSRRGDRTPREVLGGWGLFGLAGLGLVAIAWSWPPLPWPELAAAAAGLLVALVWRGRPHLRTATLEWARDHVQIRHVYTAQMTVGLLIVGVLPGYLAYHGTFVHRAEVLVRHHQLEVTDALDARRVRHQSSLRALAQDAPARRSPARPFDLAFEGLVFDTRLVPDTMPGFESAAHTHDWAWASFALLGDRVPFLTEVSIRMRQLSEAQVDRDWETRDREVMLRSSGDSVMTSTLAPLSPLGGRLFGFLLALGAIAATIYVVGRRVLFVHVEHSSPMSLGDALPEPGEKWRSVVLLGTRSIPREPVRGRSREIQIIDMMSPDVGGGDVPDLSADPEKQAVCIDHFDHRLVEPGWNRRVLAFLEEHTFAEPRLPFVLMCSRDPTELLDFDGAGSEISPDERRRWDRLLGQFTKVILSDRVPPHRFEVSVQYRMCEHLTAAARTEAARIQRDLSSLGEPVVMKPVRDRLEALELRTSWLRDEWEQLARLARESPEKGESSHGRMTSAKELERRRVETTESIRRMQENLGEAAAHLIRAASSLEGRSGPSGPSLAPRLNHLGDLMSAASSRMAFFHDPEAEDERVDWGSPAADATWSAALQIRLERGTADRVRDTLIQECACRARLQEVGRQILTRSDWPRLERDEVVDLIREGADAYYGARWAILTEAEQLVLAQLASGAVVNPSSRLAVTRLFARGFVVRHPEPRLDNESFTRYVRDRVPGDRLTRWERADTPSTWALIRGPLILGWLGVALFLFWAQQDLLGSTVAFLTTVGVGLGVIVRILTMFEGGKGVADPATRT